MNSLNYKPIDCSLSISINLWRAWWWLVVYLNKGSTWIIKLTTTVVILVKYFSNDNAWSESSNLLSSSHHNRWDKERESREKGRNWEQDSWGGKKNRRNRGNCTTFNNYSTKLSCTCTWPRSQLDAEHLVVLQYTQPQDYWEITGRRMKETNKTRTS